MTYFRKANTITLAALVGVIGVSSAQAAETRLAAKYKLAFHGLNVGRMKNSIRIGDDSYSLVGTVKTNAVVALVADTKAQFAVSGSLGDRQPIPRKHALNYRLKKERGFVKTAFSNGNVVNTSAKPKVKFKRGAVKLRDAHYKKVLDPISALVFPVSENEVGTGRGVCNRTLPIFDGKNRMDLKFTFKSKKVASADGFKGEVFTCAIRYQPVAGMRMKGRTTKFMKANRELEISLARVGKTNVYALFDFRIRTRRGIASGKAYTFKTL